MQFMYWVIGLCCISLSSFAIPIDLTNDPKLLYQPSLVQDKVLMQKITINRRFANINELVNRLNKLNSIKASVVNQSIDLPIPVNVYLANGTITDLLNQTSFKLGYSWNSHEGIILFKALNPRLKEHKASSYGNSSSLVSIAAAAPILTWVLNTHDKTLRHALTRWCRQAGWQLVWNVNADYPILTSVTITGSFESAVNMVLMSTQTPNNNVPLFANMYDDVHVVEIKSN